MSKEDIVILISVICAFVIGIIIFFIACIYRVKKNSVIIIEKMQEFYNCYYEGWYFFWPFVYRRVAYYHLKNNKKTFRLNNGKKAEITYDINNPKMFYYSKKTVDGFINEITLLKDDINFDYLKINLEKIGIQLKDIRQVKEIYD